MSSISRVSSAFPKEVSDASTISAPGRTDQPPNPQSGCGQRLGQEIHDGVCRDANRLQPRYGLPLATRSLVSATRNDSNVGENGQGGSKLTTSMGRKPAERNSSS